MKLNNKSQNVSILQEKGCKKYRNCYKSSSSSSSSSSCSSSDGSFSCLTANNSKIKNLTGTTITFTNASFTIANVNAIGLGTMNLTTSLFSNIPVIVTTSPQTVSIPTAFTSFTNTYLMSVATTFNIGKFNSIFNGVHLTIGNTTNGSLNAALVFTGTDGLWDPATSAVLPSPTIAVSANNSIEIVGLWDATNVRMIFYRLR